MKKWNARHCVSPVMQSDGHRLPSVYRVLHTLAKTTPLKQKQYFQHLCEIILPKTNS